VHAGRGGARNGDNAVGVTKVVGDDGVAVGAAVIVDVVVADDGISAGGASDVVRNAAAAVGGIGVEVVVVVVAIVFDVGVGVGATGVVSDAGGVVGIAVAV